MHACLEDLCLGESADGTKALERRAEVGDHRTLLNRSETLDGACAAYIAKTDLTADSFDS